MKKAYMVLIIVMLVYFTVPLSVCLASGIKTISGTVIGINGSQIILSTTSAAKYAAEIGSAKLTRKNGTVMQFSEILPGDKVEVKGTLWSDNSISSISVKNNSLYAHSGSFSGKITGINPANNSFTLQSKAYGDQTIFTNNFTSYTKNGSNSGFQNLELGMSASVKGLWDRTNINVAAASVTGTLRIIDIYFTGTLSIKNGTSLTVIGNGNVIYGVDAGKAAIKNNSGKVVSLDKYNLGDSLRVWGKHVSGMVAVTATEIKDNTILK